MRTVLSMSRRAVARIGVSIALYYSLALWAFDPALGGGFTSKVWDVKDALTLAAGIGRADPFAHLRGLRLAVVEQTSYHDEVLGAVLTVVEDLPTETTLYRSQLYSGFERVIADVWDLEKRPLLHPDRLAGDIRSGNFDAIVLVSCDKKFWGLPEAIEAWAERKDLHIICLLHEIEYYANPGEEQRSHLLVPAGEGRLTIGSLVEHGADQLRNALVRYQEESAELQWKEVDVFHFTPVFEIAANLPSSIHEATQHPGMISKASILGRINLFSRDYHRIFDELLSAMTDDPEAWGYSKMPMDSATEDGDLIFAPSADPHAPPPFHLELIGKDDGTVQIPLPLRLAAGAYEPVVIVRSDVDYPEFYDAIASSDVVLPAFVGDSYHKYRASASVAAAVIAKTPLLADEKTRAAYPYIRAPFVIPQNEDQSEIQTIAQRRKTAMDPRAIHSVDPSRESREWDDYRAELRKSNMDVWARVLGRTAAVF